jgi:2-polyprenyl-3-methyl-5-hydroxy-6-metoxy-1,4-benzoquinol methylase
VTSQLARECPGCGAARSRAAGTKNGFELRRCRSCGTFFTARLPAAEESKDYADYYNAANLQERPLVRARLAEVVAALDPYRRANRWLDVGCGAGTLMRAAADAGWQVEGTEVSEGAAGAVRAARFDVHVGDLSAIDLPTAGFDVVSLVEVLEHVPDPDALLARVAELVRPGGAVYVTTPNGRGISGRALRERWSVVAPPEHLQLFSVPGLRSLLSRSGFEATKAQAHGVNPHELLAGLRRGDFSAGQRGETSRQLNQSLAGSRRGRVVKQIVNSVLSATRTGDGLKLVAERRA